MRTIWFVAEGVAGWTPFMPSTRSPMSANAFVGVLNHSVSPFA